MAYSGNGERCPSSGQRGIGRVPTEACWLVRVDGKEHLRNPKWALLQTHQEVASALLSIEPNRQDHSQARLAGFGRYLNLSSVPRGEEPGHSVQRRTEVIPVSLLGYPGVERHPHPKGSCFGPLLADKGPLSLECRPKGIGSGREEGVEGVPDGLKTWPLWASMAVRRISSWR